MMKYLRLLRLEDQYLQFFIAIASGVFLRSRDNMIILWALAVTFFSFVAAIVNELTDQKDTDKHTWNPIHIKTEDRFTPLVICLMVVIFSVIGLILSYFTGLFWWGIAELVLGILYSLKPIRFKSKFGLDILAQACVFIIIPFIAPIALYHHGILPWGLIFTMTCLVIASAFPYQLADFSADLKAGLKGTHVVIGMKNSLLFGLSLSIAGLILFFIFSLDKSEPWLWALAGFTIYSLYRYLSWIKMSSLARQTASMQHFVKRVKPWSQLLVPYFLCLFILA